MLAWCSTPDRRPLPQPAPVIVVDPAVAALTCSGWLAAPRSGDGPRAGDIYWLVSHGRPATADERVWLVAELNRVCAAPAAAGTLVTSAARRLMLGG